MSKYAVVRREVAYYEGEPQTATHVFLGFDTEEEAENWIPEMTYHQGTWETVEVFNKDQAAFKQNRFGTSCVFIGIKK